MLSYFLPINSTESHVVLKPLQLELNLVAATAKMLAVVSCAAATG